MCCFNLKNISSRSKKGETIEAFLKSQNSVEAYLWIMNNIDPSDAAFQKKFNDLYGLNAARSMNKPAFYNVFAVYYHKSKFLNYAEILQDLSIATGRLEVSFGSKLLHTLKPDEPIIDKEVINKLYSCPCTGKYFYGVKKHPGNVYEAVALHYALKDCYYSFLIPWARKTGYFTAFDAAFPQATHISEIKKIDFYLWAM